MPIYEYTCKKCYRDFEEIVLKTDDTPVCPFCASAETKKLISSCRHIGQTAGSSVENTGSSGKSCAGCSAGSCSSCR